jgi:hypothetical protein
MMVDSYACTNQHIGYRLISSKGLSTCGKINDAFLSYYKYPKKIDIAGYISIDNQTSTNISPELDDRFTNKVIAMTVEDFQRNNQDQLGFQLSKDRVINNN